MNQDPNIKLSVVKDPVRMVPSKGLALLLAFCLIGPVIGNFSHIVKGINFEIANDWGKSDNEKEEKRKEMIEEEDNAESESNDAWMNKQRMFKPYMAFYAQRSVLQDIIPPP